MIEMTLAKASPHTAFVLGNGPSLAQIDLTALSDFSTIGLNAAYRYWRTIDWRPTYYACLDEVVGLSHKDEISELIREGRIKRFLLRGNLVAVLGPLAKSRKVLNFDALRSRQPLLSPRTVTTGSHAALWLASIGFKEIVLLGIDGQYKELVDGAEHRDGIELEIVDSQQDNPNYFFDGYQQAGDRYNIPNPRPGLHVEAWHEAGLKLAQASIDVFNANPRSEVTIFQYIDVKKFLTDGSEVSPSRETIRYPAPSTSLHPWTSRSKLGRFLSKQKHWLIFVASLLGVGFVIGGHLSGWGSLPTIMLVLTFGIVFGLSALLFYTRFIVSEHLANLQAVSDGLAQRLADIERFDKTK